MQLQQWFCKYCGGEFSHLSARQKGAHTTNCHASPKREEIKEKLLARTNWQKATKVASVNREVKIKTWLSEVEELFTTYQSDPLFNLGIGLYWGEGAKVKNNFAIANTDPKLLLIWLRWLEKFVGSVENYRYDIYGHQDVNKDEAISYWKTQLFLSAEQEVNFYNCNPTSSKNLKPGKCKYGTFRIVAGRGASEWNIKILHILSLMRV